MSREPADRGLTPESLEALLAMLDPDREKAGEIYEGLRRRLVGMYERRGYAYADELADETFDRAARKLSAGLVIERESPYAYFCGVAHKVFLEILRREKQKKKLLDGGGWPPPSAGEEEPDFRLEYLRECLQETLVPEQRDLLLRYHEPKQRIRARKELCDRLGIPMNALRIRVHRLRKKVEACVREKLRTAP